MDAGLPCSDRFSLTTIASMLRSLPVLLLFAAAAAAPDAQTQFNAAPGLYVVADDVDPVVFGDSEVGVRSEVGWRYASGLDAGLSVGVGRTDDAREYGGSDFGVTRRVSLGSSLGYTHALGERSGLRMDVGVGLGRALADRTPVDVSADGTLRSREATSRTVNTGQVEVSVGAFRRVSVGQVVLQPTVRAFGTGFVTAVTELGRAFTLRADAERGSGAERTSGVAVALPISTRVLGSLVTVETEAAVDLATAEVRSLVRLRLN